MSKRYQESYVDHNQTFPALAEIMRILGTTKPSLWPFLEATGQLVSGLSVGDFVPRETAGAAEDLQDDYAPIRHLGGVYSYHFHPTGDHHLAGIDHANYSFGNGTVDVPFSCGAWILPNAIATNVIIAKYDSAGNLEEYTAAPLTVGCSGVTATPVAEFHGRIALPFITGKFLSADEVSNLNKLYAVLLGL